MKNKNVSITSRQRAADIKIDPRTMLFKIIIKHIEIHRRSLSNQYRVISRSDQSNLFNCDVAYKIAESPPALK